MAYYGGYSRADVADMRTENPFYNPMMSTPDFASGLAAFYKGMKANKNEAEQKRMEREDRQWALAQAAIERKYREEERKAKEEDIKYRRERDAKLDKIAEEERQRQMKMDVFGTTYNAIQADKERKSRERVAATNKADTAKAEEIQKKRTLDAIKKEYNALSTEYREARRKALQTYNDRIAKMRGSKTQLTQQPNPKTGVLEVNPDMLDDYNAQLQNLIENRDAELRDLWDQYVTAKKGLNSRYSDEGYEEQVETEYPDRTVSPSAPAATPPLYQPNPLVGFGGAAQNPMFMAPSAPSAPTAPLPPGVTPPPPGFKIIS